MTDHAAGTRRSAVRATALVVAAVAVVAAAGCSGAQSALEPHGPEAARVAVLWWLMAAVGGAVFVVVTALVVYALVHRGPRDARDDGAHASADAVRDRRSTRWVIVGGVAIPLVILTAVYAWTLRTLMPLPPAPPADLFIEVNGRQFWWEVHYRDPRTGQAFTTANEVRIPVGRRVHVRLVAEDVIHSFWVPSLHGKVDMIPGDTNRLVLRADRAGVYRGQCAEYCGAQHAKMAFVVVAEPAERFAAWAAVQRQPAAEPATATASRGREVFVAGCAACHHVRGVSPPPTRAAAEAAGGAPGPDLTHLASRRTLAAGTLPNRRGHLGGWIANPQAVKPGNHMPVVPLDGEQLVWLLDYLQGLR